MLKLTNDLAIELELFCENLSLSFEDDDEEHEELDPLRKFFVSFATELTAARRKASETRIPFMLLIEIAP